MQLKKEKASVLYLVSRFLARVFFCLFYRYKVEGYENVPENSGAIIAPNHMSYFDPPLVAAAMKRYIHFMAKEELFSVPVLGFSIKRMNSFPVKRGAGDVHAIRNALDILKSGKLLLMFPEGTRSKDGKLGKARAGAAMAACSAQVPLVPVKIENTNKMFKFKKIKIKFGEPVFPPKDFTKEDYLKLSQKVLDAISLLKF